MGTEVTIQTVIKCLPTPPHAIHLHLKIALLDGQCTIHDEYPGKNKVNFCREGH